jgi:IS5 family transposase
MAIEYINGIAESANVIAQARALRKAGFPIKRTGDEYSLKLKDGTAIYSAIKLSRKSDKWSVQYDRNLVMYWT